jgi:putative addiction module component (TIGR02574 family)
MRIAEAKVDGLANADRVRRGKGMPAIEQIEKAVLALPVEQRVLLAESLLGSLPPVGEEWSEADELAEVERREREIAAGRVQPVNEAEFWRRVEARRQR